jgi:hypothetical protein
LYRSRIPLLVGSLRRLVYTIGPVPRRYSTGKECCGRLAITRRTNKNVHIPVTTFSQLFLSFISLSLIYGAWLGWYGGVARLQCFALKWYTYWESLNLSMSATLLWLLLLLSLLLFVLKTGCGGGQGGFVEISYFICNGVGQCLLTGCVGADSL